MRNQSLTLQKKIIKKYYYVNEKKIIIFIHKFTKNYIKIIENIYQYKINKKEFLNYNDNQNIL